MPVEDVRPVLKFTRLTEHAFPPLKGSEKAAGFDLKRYIYIGTHHSLFSGIIFVFVNI